MGIARFNDLSGLEGKSHAQQTCLVFFFWLSCVSVFLSACAGQKSLSFVKNVLRNGRIGSKCSFFGLKGICACSSELRFIEVGDLTTSASDLLVVVLISSERMVARS